MHRIRLAAPAAALALAFIATGAQAQEENRVVAGGGITVQGWTGKADGGESINNAKLAQEGDALHITTGPAITYWNPANTATGNYTVKATFREPEYMNLNNHPHPYGIVIAGNDMTTDQASYLYCSAYGNGTFIVRGFGPAAFSVSARRPEANDAINKAPGQNQPVTQEIAVTVTSDAVQCAINGTVVATYPKSDLVAAGKLKSTDGIWGIRFGHNTEVLVTGLAVTKN